MTNILIGIGIFLAKIAEISLQSIKLIFLVRGKKTLATLMAFFEVLIWSFVVSGIISSLNSNPVWLIMYCLGFALGFYVGSVITDKLALGMVNIRIIIDEKDAEKVMKYLEEKEHGFTKLIGEGAHSVSIVINTIVKKKDSSEILSDIKSLCSGHVFTTIYDIDKSIGGIGLSK